ncbi:gamma-glutamylcyclotransferase [Halobaculum sp. MBLA0147]|uniref:gamma-glutamylcyclotransferase family protein n=1 Tax=Halobaculum sp. MBLA0147 TaxID=3079934 RepID=UPI003524F939
MDVFVYGTLTDPDRVGEVLHSYVFVGPATLRGLHAVDGEYPTLAPGGEVAGRLLRTDERDRLDEYERVADGLYTRVVVPITAGHDSVADEAVVYAGDPDALDADATWPGSGSFADRVATYVTDESVCVDPQW